MLASPEYALQIYKVTDAAVITSRHKICAKTITQATIRAGTPKGCEAATSMPHTRAGVVGREGFREKGQELCIVLQWSRCLGEGSVRRRDGGLKGEGTGHLGAREHRASQKQADILWSARDDTEEGKTKQAAAGSSHPAVDVNGSPLGWFLRPRHRPEIRGRSSSGP